ncbi:hypothetical protein E8E12_000087 [Didymella heteroderae]|uniref:ubiquitinyl hydrolase 1 n=1 Tax=Didymella heteroderae TaxID=1769908 RepID=A0A9P4WFV1_9PLEO|nr:hypothetical protein E8E12_000087 [Didymella heteroderae]
MSDTRTRALERFMFRPPSTPDGPSPNEVIASLSDCPENFSMDEYKAFGMLPLGRNILYSNILAQLAAPTVDFSKAETQTLVLQMVGQVGVPHSTGGARRVSHQMLAEASFGHTLLEQLEIASCRVSENWELWRALASFVLLTRRILSLTASPEVQTRSLALLDCARRVSMKWLTRLKRRAAASTDHKQRSDLHSRASEVALLCASTFDVDDDFIDIVLQQQSAISMLLRSSIVVQENHYSVQSESKDIYETMLQSWRALLYRASSTLRQYLLRDNTHLNDAVLANWAAFRPATDANWVILSKTNEHWLHTTSGSLAVHFSLLTGELLINGHPLARLPSEYMKHPMYTPLFRNSTLEVVPTDRPGMKFSVKSTFKGCELHFGMKGVDMCVVAIQNQVVYDLLPSRLFRGQLPFAFVENYIHWYDHDRRMVIFRPRGNPWSTEDEEWRLVQDGPAWRLVNGLNVLTNVDKDTSRILSKILSPLEDQQHIHTIWNTEVDVVVPPRNNAKTPLSQCKIDDKLKTFVIDNIFAATPPVISEENGLSPPEEPELPIQKQYTSMGSGEMKLRLEQLCNNLQSFAKSRCEHGYVHDLRLSCAFLENNQRRIYEELSAWSEKTVKALLQTYLDACKEYLKKLSLALAQAITSSGSFSDGLGLDVQHAPRASPIFWLSRLHRDHFTTLSEAWKKAIIEYGLAVTQVHRAQRLIALSSVPADLIEELDHVGHSNWQPKDFPETLLLEAESGILVRREQEFIASHMRNPVDMKNIVLQLLMGGGKSSTIVPVLAAFLTDKKKLVRVIVGKPQSKQMLQMLVSKLGYLLNRRVYHMPFSRAIRPSAHEADLIREIYEECITNRGVLLVQPEHILSFKLMVVESALTGNACAQSLLGTQQFFDHVSRDIVDESDENFSVKFDLIYTMGSQRPIEFAPERWLLIQAIVGLIPRFAAQVKKTLPDFIEIRCNDDDDDGRFPRVRLLRNDAADMLLTLIAKHVVEFGVIGLPTSSQPPDIQAALLNYIVQVEPMPKDVQVVENSRFWTTATESPLLLVRGLFAGGILRFALGTKRWRVNFGLDPGRIPKTQLAVPFRSKDSPSPRSEFSHPDVVILLSLLSYYYDGLTDEQLFDSFAHLQKSDQSTIQYAEWVSTATSSLPMAFRQLSGVSTKDRHQCLIEVFPCLRYSKKTIDYYLSSLVFPKAMKEFAEKLSASGWDIGAIKKNPLTGFSGTNDTLHLLPLTVQHLDLPSQSHTNALVLQYLLQDENSVELLPQRASGTDAEHILSVVVGMEPEVRVLLDCGASILEQNNRQVAETWLKMRDQAVQAVVYFDDEELSVLDRIGRIESLQTSPFSKQLDSCLVYLDEAHTRGTDLRLPRRYRAAVTLGQSLTKDKLTQGCMRMRKLGFGQSVVFVTPEEIATKIREQTCKASGAQIGVEDVLCWSIGETWEDLKRSMPLWAVQGERFERTKTLLNGTATPLEQLQAFLEEEAQTLQVRYRPIPKGDSGGELLKKWDLTNPAIAKIMERCQDFDAMEFETATLSEEQERELAPEIEEERQIERPPRLPAEVHRVHPDLQRLVCTGDLVVHPEAIKPAFQSLVSTSAAKLFETADLPTDLLVSTDFMRTVKIPKNSSVAPFISDSYQRPVQFVLSVPSATKPGDTRTLIIISPFEANELLSTIVKYAKVTLHLYSPRANATYAPLDKLTLYNVGLGFCADQVPRSTTVQLNLFAGSRYLRSFEEYREVCDFLGLLRSKPMKDQQVFADGFINPPVGIWGLQQSPVPFLRSVLMKIRSESEGVEMTHLGKILNGVRLEACEFETSS